MSGSAVNVSHCIIAPGTNWFSIGGLISLQYVQLIVMSEWTSLSLKQGTKDALSEQREEGESWDEFMQQLIHENNSNADAIRNQVHDISPHVGKEQPDVEHIEEQLDRIEERLKDQSAVSQQQTVLNRLDDLETELTRQHEELGR